MKIEIINYEENLDPDSPVVANVLVEMGEKMKAWFTFIRSKKGMVFCNPTSVRIDKEYKPSFVLNDDIAMKKLCANVLAKTREDYKVE